MARTRVGFTGAGIIANRHLGNLLHFDDVEVVGVADLDGARATALAARCDATPYTSQTEMLARESLDAVYVCVPPFAHGAPELECVEQGVPFFVEKPIAADWETAAAVAKAVTARNLITGVGYHWHYLDTVERVQELVREHPPRLVQGFWLDFTPPPDWWVRGAQSGGQMVEQTTHIFDLARLLGGEVTRVYAAGSGVHRPAFPDADIWDVSVATLHFASGALGTMASTCVLNWPHRIALHLFCEGFAIELSEFELMIDVGQGRPIQQAQGDPFVREDRDFIDAVQGKPNRIRVPYSEAVKTQRLVTDTMRSAREGRVLDLQPEGMHV